MAGNPVFNRLQIITGKEGLASLAATRVIVFGIGGVGSWAAEALVRSGVGTIAIADSDTVCVTNVNRQVQATTASVGRPKVAELSERMRLINPSATIIPLQKAFTRTTAAEFDLGSYGYVIDAIDSLANKVDLIIVASEAGAKVFSALGASNKLDPLAIRVDSLWNSQGCPLGRYIRKRLRRKGFSGEVTCVYSEENLPLRPADFSCGTRNCRCPPTARAGGPEPGADWCRTKKQINGSAVHVTGTFGFFLAGLVVRDVLAQNGMSPPAA
jgi:tRNA threonylcarbamoyladenosine dehydratase